MTGQLTEAATKLVAAQTKATAAETKATAAEEKLAGYEKQLVAAEETVKSVKQKETDLIAMQKRNQVDNEFYNNALLTPVS